MFSLVFLRRVAEEALVAALVAAGALLFTDNFTLSLVAVAAGRAVYGVIVKNLGDRDKPSAQ